MSDAAAFLAKIIAEPDDDLPRLVYADFLDERGDPRGEFVRVQVELAKCPPEIRADRRWHDLRYACAGPDGRKWDDLRFREDAILRTMQWREWAGPVLMELWNDRIADQTLYGQRHLPQAFTFSRGFVSAVTLSWADFQTHADALLRSCPIRRVNRGKACTRCRGGIIPHSDDVPCEYCRGTGRVDDWKGDGVVRLTSLPAIDLVRPTSNGYVQRIRGGRCEVETGYGEPYESVFLKATNAEYPGVWFGLPAVEARLNDFVRDTLRQQGFSDEQIASWDRLREFTDYAARIAAASPAITALRTILSSTTGGRP